MRARVCFAMGAAEWTKTRKHESTKALQRVMGHQFEGLELPRFGGHAAMHVSLAHRALPFESQFPFEITFEEVLVGQGRIDLTVAEEIVVELKALDKLRDVHYAQLKSYLRATSLRVGLLFNSMHLPDH